MTENYRNKEKRGFSLPGLSSIAKIFFTTPLLRILILVIVASQGILFFLLAKNLNYAPRIILAVLILPLGFIAVAAGFFFIDLITRNKTVPKAEAKYPIQEIIIVGAIVILLFLFFNYNNLGLFLQKSDAVYKNLVIAGLISLISNFAVPLTFLFIVGNRLANLGFKLTSTGFMILCLFILSIFFSVFWAYQTNTSFLFQLKGFFSIFILYLLISGSEEFSWRVVLQTRIELLSKRPLDAIAITSFLFALFHFFKNKALMFEGAGNLLIVSKCFAIQGFLGLIFGYLYYRTKSLPSVAILHALINTIGRLL